MPKLLNPLALDQMQERCRLMLVPEAGAKEIAICNFIASAPILKCEAMASSRCQQHMTYNVEETNSSSACFQEQRTTSPNMESPHYQSLAPEDNVSELFIPIGAPKDEPAFTWSIFISTIWARAACFISPLQQTKGRVQSWCSLVQGDHGSR